jgi:glutamate--cysteine ligase
MVPHLTTALSGPLAALERTFIDAQPELEAYFRQQWQQHEVPFYASVDLRFAGYKLAPVDTNLYPAGFNNLNPQFHPLVVQAVMSAVTRFGCSAKSVMLIPENHTRNTYYLENVTTLIGLMQQAGVRVRVGSLIPDLKEVTPIALPSGRVLTLEPIQRVGSKLMLKDFDPCAIVLNNDLSGGVPDVLKGVSQPMVPPPFAGWTNRRKSQHFKAYDSVADEIAALLKIDPWLINPYFEQCGEVDFKAQTGLDCLQKNVAKVLSKIQTKYDQYGVTDKPFVIVKADAGTYGMGIMTVRSAEEIATLNRDARKKMAVVKEGLEVHEVIIQEGVYTNERVDESIAEPVVYMVDRFVVGGFYRVHANRAIDESLNAPGAQFVPLAFEKPCTPDVQAVGGCAPNRFYSYGVVARMAQVAAAREIEWLKTQLASEFAVKTSPITPVSLVA